MEWFGISWNFCVNFHETIQPCDNDEFCIRGEVFGNMFANSRL